MLLSCFLSMFDSGMVSSCIFCGEWFCCTFWQSTWNQKLISDKIGNRKKAGHYRSLVVSVSEAWSMKRRKTDSNIQCGRDVIGSASSNYVFSTDRLHHYPARSVLLVYFQAGKPHHQISSISLTVQLFAPLASKILPKL